MILKFLSIGEEDCQVEFSKHDDLLSIEIEHLNPHSSQEIHRVDLTKENLFELIGQLLRIQSQFKKEAKNG